MEKNSDSFLRKPQKNDNSIESSSAGRSPASQADRADLIRRERRAAESILDNERLTDALDDSAAKALVEWGLAAAKRLARGTASLAEKDADNILDEGMQATRRLMRYVNKLASGAGQMEDAERQRLVAKISEQADVIYNDPAAARAGEIPAGVLHQPMPHRPSPVMLKGGPAEIIAQLRNVFERPEPFATAVHTRADEEQKMVQRQPYQADLDTRSGALGSREPEPAPVPRRKRRLPGQSKADAQD